MSGGVDDIDVDIDDHRDHRNNNNNMNDSTTTIEIKHGKASIHIEISKRSTIRELKRKIERETGIEPMNQKMPNLKLGKHLAPDEASIESLGKLPNKVMLLGKSTKDVTELKNLEKEMLEKAPEILDDFESDVLDSEPLLCYADPVYVARLAARVEKYKGLSPLNETREGKKLLVLDIDYTLFDHRTPGENAQELARPYLHDFLSSAYKRYDIVIWSATSMLWVKTKMQELGVLSHPSYKILALVDSGSMITVQTKERGIFNCKPLGWIWAQPWSQERGYDSSNTIMFDDLRRNFAMNPSSGLKIKPFRNAHTSRATDNELKKLKVYVDIIARENVDFKTLDHKKWERYVLKVLKEGKLSEHEAKEVKSFWPNSTVVRELLANQQPAAVAAQTGNQQQQQQQQQEQREETEDGGQRQQQQKQQQQPSGGGEKRSGGRDEQ